MEPDAERIGELWAEAWDSWRAAVTTHEFDVDPDSTWNGGPEPLIKSWMLADELEGETERLRELVFLARDAGITEVDPVREYRWAARFVAARGRQATGYFTFGRVATAFLLDWFKDEQRFEKFDPLAMADRLRDVEDSDPPLRLDYEILRHYFTTMLHRDIRENLLSSLRQARGRAEWSRRLTAAADVWARILSDLAEDLDPGSAGRR